MKTSKNLTSITCPKCGTNITLGQESGTPCAAPNSVQVTVNGSAGNGGVSLNISGTDLSAIVSMIQDGGYLEVPNIVRRYIPSHALRMLNDERGFHKCLVNLGVDYSWKVLINELKAVHRLLKESDVMGVADRLRWYNLELAVNMAKDWVGQLKEYADGLKTSRNKVYRCGGRPYIKLKSSWNKQGTFIDDEEYNLTTLLDYLKVQVDRIENAPNEEAIIKRLEEFNDFRKSFNFEGNVSKAFTNAYKAAGGYYTMKDFIMFEGFRMEVDKNGKIYDGRSWSKPADVRMATREESLKALEEYADSIVNGYGGGIKKRGYEILGTLKRFLEYNGFDYSRTMEDWKKQSMVRKALRSAAQNRRPRK